MPSSILPFIVFMGGGNMANALVSGLISHGHPPSRIHVVDRHAEKRQAFMQLYGIQASDDYKRAIDLADVLVFAIKPHDFSTLINEVAHLIQRRNPIVVSIMSGLRLVTLQAALPEQVVVRAMPNTPALVQAGITLLTADATVPDTQLSIVKNLFDAVGQTIIIPSERAFEQLTALTGCGPAFVFYLVDLFAQAMQDITPDMDCLPLSKATFQGALALMQKEQNKSPDALIMQISPKGGMTAEAMKILNDADIKTLMKKTYMAAINQGDALSKR